MQSLRHAAVFKRIRLPLQKSAAIPSVGNTFLKRLYTTGRKPLKNYYNILGVEYDATEDEIKEAWARKSREVHPDTAADGKSCAASLAELKEAYNVLSDKNLRKEFNHFYDHRVDVRNPIVQDTEPKWTEVHSPFKWENFKEYCISVSITVVLAYIVLHIASWFHPDTKDIERYDPSRHAKSKAKMEAEMQELLARRVEREEILKDMAEKRKAMGLTSDK